MKQKKIYGALAVALTASLAVAGCSGGGNGSGSDSKGGVEKQDTKDAAKLVNRNQQDRANLEQGGTFTMALASMPVNYNNFHSDGNTVDTSQITAATDPFLFNYAPDGTISNNPDFLTKMPEVKEEGGKEVVTYTINPKATWNDGTKIDHTAFAATWNALKAPMDKGGFNNIINAGYEDIEKVEKGGADNEVKVTFKKKFYPVTEVFGSLLHPKAGMDAKLFNEGMVADFHNEYRANAFIVDKIDTTAKTVTLVPNPKWWGEKPLLAKIIHREMEDSATIPAFKNNELDVTGVATKSRFQQIQGANGLDIRRGQRLSTIVLNFNSKTPPLNDVQVRKALWQAIDRQQWKKVRYDGLNWTEPDVGSNLFFGFQKEYEDNYPVKFSTADAGKTLEAAGYTKGADGFYAKGGQKLTVKNTYFGDDPTQVALARTLQSQAKAAGIDMQLDQRASSAFSEAMQKKNFGIVSMGYSTTSVSPLTTVCQLMCLSNENNLSFAGDAQLDERIKKVGEISDPAAQAKEMNAIEKEWMGKYYGTLPLANGPIITAYRKGIANIGPSLFQGLNMHWENVGWQKGMKKG